MTIPELVGEREETSSKIHVLSFAPECCSGTEETAEVVFISSDDLNKILVAMLFKLLDNLQMIIKKDSFDVQNQGNNGLSIANSSESQFLKMKKEYDDYKYKLEHLSWWEKFITWCDDNSFAGLNLMSGLMLLASAALTAASFGAAAGVAALVIGYICASGALDGKGPLGFIGNGINAAAGDNQGMKIFLKAVVIVVLSLACGAGATAFVASEAKGFVFKTMATMMFMQLFATSNISYDIALAAQGGDETTTTKENQDKKRKAMIAALITNVILMIASMKCMSSWSSKVDLTSLSDKGKLMAAIARNFIVPVCQILQSATLIYKGKIQLDQADHTEFLTQCQRAIEMFKGLKELNAASTSGAQENMKSDLKEYEGLYRDAIALAAANRAWAQAILRT